TRKRALGLAKARQPKDRAMYLPARPQQRVKIVSRDGGGKSYNLDIVTRVKQPSAARTHDAGHQYPFPVGRHARPRPDKAIPLPYAYYKPSPWTSPKTSPPRSSRSGRRCAQCKPIVYGAQIGAGEPLAGL